MKTTVKGQSATLTLNLAQAEEIYFALRTARDTGATGTDAALLASLEDVVVALIRNRSNA